MLLPSRGTRCVIRGVGTGPEAFGFAKDAQVPANDEGQSSAPAAPEPGQPLEGHDASEAEASTPGPAKKKPRIATSDHSQYPEWSTMEYIWEACSQILHKATNCEFRQAQSSTQATDTLRFADAFAGGSQWMITRDQIQDLVRLGSHQTRKPFQLHSYGQLKAYCDERRAQAAVIRQFYKITGGGTQDTIGFVAFQHPAIRKLIQEQFQFSDEQLDQVCGVVPDALKLLLQQTQPLGTDFQIVPPAASAYLQNAGLSVPVHKASRP